MQEVLRLYILHSTFCILHFLQVPNGCSLALHIIPHLQPEGENHVNDERRTDGKKRGINKKKTNNGTAHPQPLTEPCANAEGAVFKKFFYSFNKIHLLQSTGLFLSCDCFFELLFQRLKGSESFMGLVSLIQIRIFYLKTLTC